MGQGEVKELLELKEDWMSVQDIADALKQGRGSVSNNLKRLEEQGEATKYERSPCYGGNLWRIKNKLRL
jgi:predicted transcriptional regulator